MLILWLHLLLMLVIILIAAQLFTNALEHFGQKIKISAGVTGSIFAAIATALPETTVPILAIVAGTPDKYLNQEISVGAILGAPLMLSTLSTFIMALFAIKKRGIKGRISPEHTGFARDLNFFLIAFFLAAVAMYVPLKPIYLRACIGVLLIVLYFVYIVVTFRASKDLVFRGHGVMTEDPLRLVQMGLREGLATIILQLILGLVLLLFAAKGFINGVEDASHALHISPLLLSLLIIPLATELPEKVNSIFWVQKKKDTLAFGNITGAMVFQGTILPALGIMLTPWQPVRIVETGIFITFAAVAWLRLHAGKQGVGILALLVNGILYFIYLYLTLGLA